MRIVVLGLCLAAVAGAQPKEKSLEAVREWVESELPSEMGTSPGGIQFLEGMLRGKLPEGVSIEFRLLPELPNTLAVIAGVDIECGTDQAVYFYRFERDRRVRVFADHPGEYEGAQIQVSEADASGRRLLLVHYYSVQCASMWMGMAYSVYRVDTGERLIEETHSFRLTDDGPHFTIRADELSIEFVDWSIDMLQLMRDYILHYSLAYEVKRIDPLALSPQGFVEEWLTEPWSEMESRSAVETKSWHESLHADFVSGEFRLAAPCPAKHDLWLVGYDINRVGDKEFDPPLPAFMLVKDLGDNRYRMESVSERGGCR